MRLVIDFIEGLEANWAGEDGHDRSESDVGGVVVVLVMVAAVAIPGVTSSISNNFG